MSGGTDGWSCLADRGLNLAAVLRIPDLEPGVRDALEPPPHHDRVVVLAHGGRRLWETLGDVTGPDPVDRHALAWVEHFMHTHVRTSDYATLYPFGPPSVPLQALGRAAGWTHPSPVGLDITAQFGLWFAYRAVVTTASDLPAPPSSPARPSPCSTCVETPCVDACPAGAVSIEGLDGAACMAHRLSEGSACADRCLARLACPVATEHRYTMDQVRYHYRLSLRTLRRWRAGG